MKIFISILLIILQISVWSQNAIIKVVDSETNEVLPFVNICFEVLNADQKTFTTTNLKGIAKNTCNNRCVVALSFVGYKTLIDTLNVNQSVNYKLIPDLFNLEQVTVTATRTEKHLKDAPVITQVITSQDIENRGLTNVQDVLTDDMPSVDFQQTGFGTNIQMQGLGAAYILFLIDGERIAGETGGNIDYSRLNTANIERIEIVKGAASAMYGSQAMGGVINIITKKPRKKIEVSLGSKLTQYNQLNYSNLKTTDPRFYHKQNLDRPNLNNNVSVGLNIKKLTSRTDFVIKSYDAYKIYDKEEFAKKYSNVDTLIYAPKDSINIDGYEDYSISQKFEYKISDKLTVGVKGSYYNHNQYGFSTTGSYKNNIDYTYGGNINYNFSKNSSVLISFYSDTYDKNKRSEDSKELLKNEYSNQIYTPRIIYNTVYKKNKITAGSEYINEKLVSDKFVLNATETDERKSETYVFFAQDDVDINEKINFILGARADIHSTYGLHFTPKASLMYKAKKLTYRLNYANGFRSPSLKELYMNWDHLGMFDIVGNEDLMPESNNYFSFATELTAKKLNTSLTIYHNRFNNKIELVEKTAGIYEYVNFDYSNIFGIDVSAKYQIINGLIISGGYTYLNENRSSKVVRVSQISPHSSNIRLEYKFRRGIYNAIINLSGKYYGVQNYISGEEITYQGADVYAEYPIHYAAYSMWKLSIAQGLLNSINLIFSVDNIFDYTSGIASYSSNLTPGRRFSIGLNISLDKLYEYKKINN